MADEEVKMPSIEELRQQKLVSWVVSHVQDAQSDWEREWKDRFDDYYRIWRGIYSDAVRERESERSKLIHPQLQAAIDSTHAEIVSAVVHPKTYFQIEDTGEKGETVQIIQKNLMEDFDKAKIKRELINIALLGTLFGTGIAKVVVGKKKTIKPRQNALGELAIEAGEETLVSLRPLLPHEFVIDSAATSIEEALFVAAYEDVPRHLVLDKQNSGAYLDNKIGSAPSWKEDRIEGEEEPVSDSDDHVKITEYYGKVPKQLLPGNLDDVEIDTDENDESVFPEVDEDDLVEAVVVVGNDTAILRERENPLVNKDRLFLAYRHEEIPGQFWGRGVAEKGYNAQKALDSNLRARQDALALTVHPMYEINTSLLPRNFKFKIHPGRAIPTVGAGAITKIDMGQLSPEQFNNTSELQQMVQVATGAVDQQPQGTAGAQNGFNLQAINFVKRSQIAIANFSEEFVVPFVELSSRIYMQFNPERYPPTDVSFKATAALGSLAKEMEQAQLINLLKTMQFGPTYLAILLSVVNNSSVQEKDMVAALVTQQLQASLQPPEPDPMIAIKQAEVEGRIRAEQARQFTEFLRAQAELARAATDARRADSSEAKDQSQAILNLAKADEASVGNQLTVYKAILDQLTQANSTDTASELSNQSIATAQQVTGDSIFKLLQGS